MPSDSNGNFTLVPGYLATTGTTIQASQHNPPLEDIAAGITGRLPRSGNAPMVGPLKLVDGSEGLPGLSFNSATQTGIYKTTNGFGIAVNGAKVIEFVPGGVKGVHFVGELIDLTLTTVPPLCVRPVGQTLSRAAYPELWQVAQNEIASGQNLFYNNGNGSDTFGIGDMRGRFRAARDNMGGAAANRITAAYFGNANYNGSVGGLQSNQLGAGNLPPHQHSGSTALSSNDHNHSQTGPNLSGPFSFQSGSSIPNKYVMDGSIPLQNTPTGGQSANHNHAFTTDNGPGSATPFSIVPPVMITDCVLFAGA